MSFCTCNSYLVMKKELDGSMWYVCPKNKLEPESHIKMPYDETKPVKILFQNYELNTSQMDDYHHKLVKTADTLAKSRISKCGKCNEPLMIISLEENILICKSAECTNG